MRGTGSRSLDRPLRSCLTARATKEPEAPWHKLVASLIQYVRTHREAARPKHRSTSLVVS